MKQSLALTSVEIWNRKNLPSDIERFGEAPGKAGRLLEQLPAALRGFARQRRDALLLVLAALGTLAVVWYASKAD